MPAPKVLGAESADLQPRCPLAALPNTSAQPHAHSPTPAAPAPRAPHPPCFSLQVLTRLHDLIIPALSNPLLLSDFLTHSLDKGEGGRACRAAGTGLQTEGLDVALHTQPVQG